MVVSIVETDFHSRDSKNRKEIELQKDALKTG